MARPLTIKTRDLTKSFNGEVAVNEIDLEVPEGSIFGFIGPSGSGKTTTVRLLMGLYEPDRGEISVLGVRPDRFSRRERERIGYLPQLFVLSPDLTIWENMNFAASLYGVPFLRTKRLNELLDLEELREDKHKLVRNISGGMQRRLSLASTLIHNPSLLFLDEPTAPLTEFPIGKTGYPYVLDVASVWLFAQQNPFSLTVYLMKETFLRSQRLSLLKIPF